MKLKAPRSYYIFAALALVLVGAIVWASWERNRVNQLEGMMKIRADDVRQLEEQNEMLRQSVERITRESQRVIAEAQNEIDRLRGEVNASRARERAIESRLREIQTRTEEQVKEVPQETDAALISSVEQELGIQILQTPQGFLVDRTGLESIRILLLRFDFLQAELQAKDEQLREKDLQITRLENLILEQNRKFNALNDQVEGLGQRLEMQDRLLQEQGEYLELILQQNKALRRQGWLERTITVAALGAIVVAAAF